MSLCWKRVSSQCPLMVFESCVERSVDDEYDDDGGGDDGRYDANVENLADSVAAVVVEPFLSKLRS